MCLFEANDDEKWLLCLIDRNSDFNLGTLCIETNIRVSKVKCYWGGDHYFTMEASFSLFSTQLLAFGNLEGFLIYQKKKSNIGLS